MSAKEGKQACGWMRTGTPTMSLNICPRKTATIAGSLGIPISWTKSGYAAAFNTPTRSTLDSFTLAISLAASVLNVSLQGKKKQRVRPHKALGSRGVLWLAGKDNQRERSVIKFGFNILRSDFNNQCELARFLLDTEG